MQLEFCANCGKDFASARVDETPETVGELVTDLSAPRYPTYCRRCRRAERMSARYGLPYHIFQRMLFQQKRQCAICKLPFKSSKTIHVDHNHETGKVRGLLCHNCNTGLGLYRDNPQTLATAIEYLEAV